jgi:Ca-activated chloride channel family protein
VGLVAFGRFADTVAPLSRSREIVVKLAQQTRLAMVRGEDGTAIGEGLALAAARLRAVDEGAGVEAPDSGAGAGEAGDQGATVPKEKIKSKVVVLMTDGQNNAGAIDPMEAAELCKRWGMRVYTIGVGAGAERVMRMGGLFGDMRIPVGSGVDEQTLQQIAEATGGRYFAASDGAALREVYATIDKLERSVVKAPESTLYEELFMPWAMAGGAAGALAGVLRATLFRSLS